MRLTNDPPVLLDDEEAARVLLTVRHLLRETRLGAAAWGRLLAHIDAQADRIRELEDELGAMTVALRVAGSDLERQAERITQLEGEVAEYREDLAGLYLYDDQIKQGDRIWVDGRWRTVVAARRDEFDGENHLTLDGDDPTDYTGTYIVCPAASLDGKDGDQ